MYTERLFCFKHETQFALQHGSVYLVAMDTEFSDDTVPGLLRYYDAAVRRCFCDTSNSRLTATVSAVWIYQLLITLFTHSDRRQTGPGCQKD